MMEDKRLYLELIQGVINRLSQNSFLLKGWSVILVTGLFSLSNFKESILLMLLAFFPAISFWILDSYFLRQERLYRALYDSVRKKSHDIDFSMNVSEFEKDVDDALTTIFSKTLCLFHGCLFFTLFVVTILSVLGDQNGT